MSQTLAQPTTIEQFLAWEERQELRHEFDGVRVLAMTGGTGGHAAIQAGLLRSLGVHLDGKPCQVYGSELKIKMANSVRYPDAFVTCPPVSPKATFAAQPLVIFEILSPSTGSDDLGGKRLEYQAVASLQRYVVLAQTHRVAHVFQRRGEGWDVEVYLGADAVLDMPEIGISLPLADIYQGIALAGDADEAG